MANKWVYMFSEGDMTMRNLLGGKGANVAEMNLLGIPVPPGFTITTDMCNEYYRIGKDAVVNLLKDDVENAVKHIENLMDNRFGDPVNPLLVSVRSGARASMPGMMDTILNLGLKWLKVLPRKQIILALLMMLIAVLFRCTAMLFSA